MNSGRRTSTRRRRCLQPTLPAAAERAELTEYAAHAHPVGEARARDGRRKADREVVYARDTASRDHEAIADEEGWKDEAEQRCPVAKLHGLFSCAGTVVCWAVRHMRSSAPTRNHRVVRPRSGMP